MAKKNFPIIVLFQSTLPVRGATHIGGPGLVVEFISIHAPREGSDLDNRGTLEEIPISIHAPREGSDDR